MDWGGSSATNCCVGRWLHCGSHGISFNSLIQSTAHMRSAVCLLVALGMDKLFPIFWSEDLDRTLKTRARGEKKGATSMAANFWASSHFKRLLDPDEASMVHPIDREKGLTEDEFKIIKIHITNHMWKLAQLVKVRQRVIATAVTYFRRVYTRRSMSEYDPRIVAPTCLYLASKAEESTVQARLLVFYIKKMCSDEKYIFEIKDILEMEMKLLEALDFYLVVYHPYRALLQLLQDAGMTDLTNTCWGLVNDTYRMDLILIYPPYMIALACINIASVVNNKETTAWFEELRVDMNVVKNISIDILDFFDAYKVEAYKVIPERINAALNKLAVKA